jgi:hypothetical protein
MFNKSEIMRNAWAIKNGACQDHWAFSYCLKKAWAQAKAELVKANRPIATVAVPYGEWKGEAIGNKLGPYEYNPSTKCVDIDLNDGVKTEEVSYSTYRNAQAGAIKAFGNYIVSIANSYNSTTKTIKVLYI